MTIRERLARWLGRSDAEVRFVGEMQRVAFGPGDTLVICFPGRLTIPAREQIRDHIRAEFQDNKVLVFEGGAKIGVLSPTTEVFNKISVQPGATREGAAQIAADIAKRFKGAA